MEIRGAQNEAVRAIMASKKAGLKAINRKRSHHSAFGWKVPDSLQKLKIPDELKNLDDGTPFFLYDSGKNSTYI